MNLLEQYLALTTDEARAEFLAGLTADELAELNTAAEESFAEAEAAAPSDENLATLSGLADTLEAIAGEDTRRTEAAAHAEEERAAIIARVRGGDQTAEGEGAEGDGDAAGTEGEGGDAGDGTATPAEGDAPAEGEQVEQEAVAAGGAPVLRRERPALSQVRATARPAGPAADGSTHTPQRAALVAAADVPQVAAGSVLVASGSDDLTALGQAILGRWNAMAGSKARSQAIVASATAVYPEDRILDSHNAVLNMERVRRVTDAARQGGQALVAAGGYCAPATIRYDLPTVGSTARPIRDALPQFQAPRGRARWMVAPTLADVPDDAITDWSLANDVSAAGNPHLNPDDDVLKPCARITCPDEDDVELDAIVRCLEFGNFNARTYPELVEAYNRLVGVAWARHAEQRLLTRIDAASTAVTSAARGGATADLLADIDRLVSNVRGVYRVEETRVRVILPVIFREMARTDLMLQMPGGGTFDERYAFASARIDAWFAARNVNVTWTLDSQVEALIGAGAIPALPTTVVARVFVEGTFAFVDGGTLDLGVIRDGSLVATNDFKQFAESWETVAKVGNERPYVLTSTVCANGTVSGTSAITC